MKGSRDLVWLFLVLWLLGTALALTACATKAPLSHRVTGMGLVCLSIAALANVGSAIFYGRSWGHLSSITANNYGIVFFRVVSVLYLGLSGVCAWGAARFLT